MTRTLRRTAGVAVAAIVLAVPAAASATPEDRQLGVAVFPPGFYTLGVDAASNGAFDGYVHTDPPWIASGIVRQLRDGAEVSAYGQGPMPVDIEPGDVFRLERGGPGLTPTVVLSHKYAGTPLDSTTCVGHAGFSGRRLPGATVEVTLLAREPHGAAYLHWFDVHPIATGLVQSLTDTGFVGAFPVAVASGDALQVTQTTKTAAPNVTTTIRESVVTIASGCPQVFPPATAAAKPSLRVDRRTRLTVMRLLAHGLTSYVWVGTPATITQTLVIPKHGRTKALKLGTGRRVARAAGEVKVVVKLSPAGRRAVRAARKTIAAALQTSVRDKAGHVTAIKALRVRVARR
jgi:hypothetical protein